MIHEACLALNQSILVTSQGFQLVDQRGWPAAERTVRRTLHRLGWRWKRPKYVLGRPDPAYAQKKGRSSSK